MVDLYRMGDFCSSLGTISLLYFLISAEFYLTFRDHYWKIDNEVAIYIAMVIRSYFLMVLMAKHYFKCFECLFLGICMRCLI